MKKGFIAGAIAGGIVAAATSLLVTPKKGADLRADAQVKYQDVKAKTTTMVQRLQAKLNKKSADQADETASNISLTASAATEETQAVDTAAPAAKATKTKEEKTETKAS